MPKQPSSHKRIRFILSKSNDEASQVNVDASEGSTVPTRREPSIPHSGSHSRNPLAPHQSLLNSGVTSAPQDTHPSSCDLLSKFHNTAMANQRKTGLGSAGECGFSALNKEQTLHRDSNGLSNNNAVSTLKRRRSDSESLSDDDSDDSSSRSEIFPFEIGTDTDAETGDAAVSVIRENIISLQYSTAYPEGDKNLLVINPTVTLPKTENESRDVIIVLDTSGSMRSNNKIEHAKQATISVLNALNEGDTFSILCFNNTASWLQRRTTLEKRAEVEANINNQMPHPSGSTNLESALCLLNQSAIETPNETTVFLITDGKFNQGLMEETSLITEWEQRLYGNGTLPNTLCIGIGDDYSVVQLMSLGKAITASNGFLSPPIHVNSAAQLTRFMQELPSLIGVAGPRLKLIVSVACQQSSQLPVITEQLNFGRAFEGQTLTRSCLIRLPESFRYGSQLLVTVEAESIPFKKSESLSLRGMFDYNEAVWTTYIQQKLAEVLSNLADDTAAECHAECSRLMVLTQYHSPALQALHQQVREVMENVAVLQLPSGDGQTVDNECIAQASLYLSPVASMTQHLESLYVGDPRSYSPSADSHSNHSSQPLFDSFPMGQALI